MSAVEAAINYNPLTATPVAETAAPAIQVRGLVKNYDGFEAVKGVDLDIAAGEIFGIIGPDGAGA